MEDDDDNESSISVNQNKNQIFWSNGYDREMLANTTNASTNKYGGGGVYGRNRSNRNNRKYAYQNCTQWPIYIFNFFIIKFLVTNEI